MIVRATSWAYPNARLRSFVGRLADRLLYDELARLPLPDCVARLIAKPPAGLAGSDIPERIGDPGPALYPAYKKHFLALGRLLSDRCKDHFLLATEHLVVDDLKQLIRRLAGKSNRLRPSEGSYIALGSSPLGSKLVDARSLDDVGAALGDTPYEEPYDRALKTWRRHGEILAFEVALDLSYHRRLLESCRGLPAADARAVEHLFRRQCDIKNLGWILRFRFNYELSEVEIFNYTLSYGYELDDDRVLALSQITQLEQVWPIIDRLAIGRFLRRHMGAALSLGDFDSGLARYWDLVLHDALGGVPFGLTPFLAYLGLKELEMDRIRRILTGHQLDLEPYEIVEGLRLEPSEGRPLV